MTAPPVFRGSLMHPTFLVMVESFGDLEFLKASLGIKTTKRTLSRNTLDGIIHQIDDWTLRIPKLRQRKVVRMKPLMTTQNLRIVFLRQMAAMVPSLHRRIVARTIKRTSTTLLLTFSSMMWDHSSTPMSTTLRVLQLPRVLMARCSMREMAFRKTPRRTRIQPLLRPPFALWSSTLMPNEECGATSHHEYRLESRGNKHVTLSASSVSH